MMSLFVAKLFDPISFALALAVIQFSRMKWIILPAALSAAVVGETIVVSIQQAGDWGQGLSVGLLAGLVQASVVFGVRWLFDARRRTPNDLSGIERAPTLDRNRSGLRHDRPRNGIDDVEEHLEKMGYRLTVVGAGYAIMQRKSGFKAVEVASQIALHTLALEIRSAAANSERTAEIVEDAKRIAEVLDGYKSDGTIHAIQWENDTKAIAGLAFPGARQDDWLDATLSNPMVGETRLAVSLFDDEEDLADGLC